MFSLTCIGLAYHIVRDFPVAIAKCPRHALSTGIRQTRESRSRGSCTVVVRADSPSNRACETTLVQWEMKRVPRVPCPEELCW
jgi:hypothetical protein